jgi:tRNA dimethylallyltransferase
LDKVVVIAGPTASGKSAYALHLAKTAQAFIINADSLQVYRDLEILTAQPSLAEQKLLPYHLYGILDPQETCSVGRWLPLALAAIKTAHEKGCLPIVVGGTGFYLRALIEGLSPLPSQDADIRAALQTEETTTLYQELQTVDPLLADRLNPNDRQRIMRGVEVFRGTGTPLSFWQASAARPTSYTFESYLFLPPPDVLEARIAQRLENMLKNGVLEEISQALKKPISMGAQKALGFKEFSAHLQGKISLEEAKALTLVHTRQYAKRQRTWFRHQFKANHLIDSL